MNKMRMMSVLYASLIGLMVWLAVVPLAAAQLRAFPSWDQKLTKAWRFVVLTQFGGAAVLDKETGLVWDRSPDTTQRNWLNAQVHCNGLAVSGRKGWRLPTIQELTSLIDPTQSNPTLPLNHPFQNVQSSVYWSATTSANSAINAWGVALDNGNVGDGGGAKTNENYVWCVRGGQGVDPQ